VRRIESTDVPKLCATADRRAIRGIILRKPSLFLSFRNEETAAEVRDDLPDASLSDAQKIQSPRSGRDERSRGAVPVVLTYGCVSTTERSTTRTTSPRSERLPGDAVVLGHSVGALQTDAVAPDPGARAISVRYSIPESRKVR
jgi:hypothetical protein